MTKIVLIEAHPLMRLGLHHMLGSFPRKLDIVAMDEKSVPEFAALQCPIDLLVFGSPLDAEQGMQALAKVAALLRPMRVLVLYETTGERPCLAQTAMPNIYGCISKTASAEVLHAALQLGLAGGECFPTLAMPSGRNSAGRAPGDASLMRPAGNESMNAARNTVGDGTPAYPPSTTVSPAAQTPAVEASMEISEGAQLLNVTPRQFEVLRLLAKGYPLKMVSRILNISTATAKAHSSTLYQRLQVNSKGEAVYAAQQRGARLG